MYVANYIENIKGVYVSAIEVIVSDNSDLWKMKDDQILRVIKTAQTHTEYMKQVE